MEGSARRISFQMLFDWLTRNRSEWIHGRTVKFLCYGSEDDTIVSPHSTQTYRSSIVFAAGALHEIHFTRALLTDFGYRPIRSRNNSTSKKTTIASTRAHEVNWFERAPFCCHHATASSSRSVSRLRWVSGMLSSNHRRRFCDDCSEWCDSGLEIHSSIRLVLSRRYLPVIRGI